MDTITLRQILELPDPAGTLRPIRAISGAVVPHNEDGGAILSATIWWLRHDADGIERVDFERGREIFVPLDMIAAIYTTPDDAADEWYEDEDEDEDEE